MPPGLRRTAGLWYRSSVPADSKQPPSPTPEDHEGAERRKAALAAFGEQLASAKLDELEDFGELEDLGELEDKAAPSLAVATSDSATSEDAELGIEEESLANADLSGPAKLEPIGDDAHPPQNRRMPTQPHRILALELGKDEPGPSESNDEEPRSERPPSSARPYPPPRSISRQSPAPLRRGLFAVDRVTNLLAGGAVGLLLAIYPAKKLAESYEQREVRPLLTELDRSIERPLGVEAGVVESPESVAQKIDEGRSKTRRRYALIWLLSGLPLGVGLGLAPRP